MYAQTASERYTKGIEFMKKKQWTDAITQFKQSKIINKSPENVQRCNTQIKVCEQHLTPPPPPPPIPVELKIDKKNVSFSAYRSQYKIAIKSDPWPDWDFKVIGADWLSVKRGNNPLDEIYLYIECDDNINTQQRTAMIVVTTPRKERAGRASLSDTIRIIQVAGNSVVFYVDGETNYACKRKGAQIVAKIRSNSMVKYAENNNQNWRVVNMPNWCQLSSQKEDKKGWSPVASDELVVTVLKNEEGKEREGNIRLESQNNFVNIRITQKK